MLIQRSRNVRSCYITYSGKKDGAGSQVHNIISLMIFAKRFRLKYVHTPLKNIAHAPKLQADWDSKWDNFFNLGHKEIKLNEVKSEEVKTISIRHPSFFQKKKQTICSTRLTHLFTEYYIEDYEKIADELREKFFLNKAPKPPVDHVNIAVHIRRGDVKNNKQTYARSNTCTIT